MTKSSFTPGQLWLDNNGVHINAHGGGILFHEDVYYWFGEHKIEGEAGNLAHVGVHAYSSRDLNNWKDEGVALAVSDDPACDIVKECVIERPKVIRHPRNGTFVMWFHLERGKVYSAARVGVALADNPTGPYVYQRSFRLNAGHWPINVTAEQKAGLANIDALKGKSFSGAPNEEVPRSPILARDFVGGQMSRDMTLFVDDDGSAYHLCASEENSTLHISELSDDFLSTTGKYVRVFENRWNEAPAICRYQGRYWLLSSGCTGWAPNPARAAVADSIWGPWTELANPCVGVNPNTRRGPELTFGGQSTYILPVAGKPGTFIAMFDEWHPKNAINGRYYWLPMTFADGKYTVEWRDEWSL